MTNCVKCNTRKGTHKNGARELSESAEQRGGCSLVLRKDDATAKVRVGAEHVSFHTVVLKGKRGRMSDDSSQLVMDRLLAKVFGGEQQRANEIYTDGFCLNNST